MAKQMVFESDAREAILRGVDKLAKAVTTTLGPRGRNAVIDKGWGAPTVTKDGVTVAEEIQLQDPYEQMGAQLVKEVASKTSDVAGDTKSMNQTTKTCTQCSKWSSAFAPCSSPGSRQRTTAQQSHQIASKHQREALPSPAARSNVATLRGN